MLKMGFLASTNFYASIAHKDEHFDNYFNALDKVYKVIGACENGDKNIDDFLEGPICHAGFKRLN
jgi:glutamate-1-semialdehyde 2,1-aminomutase